MASFWKVSDNEVRVEPTNFTHFYAQTSGDQTEKYVLVFNQRFKGDNQFVYISSMLNVSETYYATIVKIGDVIELAVHTDSERTELIWAPGPQILSENMYKYLLLCVTRDFGVDREVWSSGHISYLETYNFN